MAYSKLKLQGTWDPSPLQHNIVLGYYDGPTEAVSKVGSATVHVEMIAWDREQEIRCYKLSQIEDGAFDRVEALCRTFAAPRYPDWLIVWDFPSGAAERAAIAALDEVLSSQQAPSWIGLGPGLSGPIRFRNVTGDMLVELERQGLGVPCDDLGRWKKYF